MNSSSGCEIGGFSFDMEFIRTGLGWSGSVWVIDTPFLSLYFHLSAGNRNPEPQNLDSKSFFSFFLSFSLYK